MDVPTTMCPHSYDIPIPDFTLSQKLPSSLHCGVKARYLLLHGVDFQMDSLNFAASSGKPSSSAAHKIFVLRLLISFLLFSVAVALFCVVAADSKLTLEIRYLGVFFIFSCFAEEYVKLLNSRLAVDAKNVYLFSPVIRNAASGFSACVPVLESNSIRFSFSFHLLDAQVGLPVYLQI